MKFTTQILFVLTAICLFITGAVWGSHSVVSAQSSAGNPVKLQDGTNNTYLAEVTSFKALPAQPVDATPYNQLI